uniref:NACHT domain-containing protein n=1 Tax=Sparus aurata TaxID=8175 RepID=A0A671TVE5_SPAAU
MGQSLVQSTVELGLPGLSDLSHYCHLYCTIHQLMLLFLCLETHVIICQRKLKSNLKKKFQFLFEGVAKAGNSTLLNQIYTELFITEGGTGEVIDQHEVRQIEIVSRKTTTPETTIKYEDIFKASPGRDKPIRTVMTKGVAGIGKTVLTQKFTLDWAENKANQDIQFTFPFTFRELNVLRRKKYSLIKLLHHFFSETKEAGDYSFNKPQVVFIFDGLDECRLPLDFHHNKILTNVTKSTSLDVLLTNLIRGKLLPSARLWITTRPAAANQIPPECVDMVTEVRGFTDPQKEEYFRKRFKDTEMANRIISHIKTSQSLHIMCHIPVFCWITATVLKHVSKTGKGGELPKTLTEMYIHFLVVQSKLKNVKYDGGAETDPHWTPESRKMILSLGKLAFEQLQKGNLIFYESDLTECGINIKAATVYSGVFTQIFKEERGLYQDKVFCFVHLSVQEFLAAVHVHLTFVNHGDNLAVDKALQSPNGHLDLFLRFLLGLSLETNQALLNGVPKCKRSSSQNNQKTVQYIKKMIRKYRSPERSINLFHCLNELKDHSLLEEIQLYLASGRPFTDKLSPAQWSALVFFLLSSDKHLSVCVFYLFFFRLSDCNLSEQSLAVLATVFKSQSCSLKELDLSNNNLKNSGVELLSERKLFHLTCRLNQTGLTETCCDDLSSVLASELSTLRKLYLSHNRLLDSGVLMLCGGLKSPHCKMEDLSLSSCSLSERSCVCLDLVLNSGSSSLRKLDLSMNYLNDSGVKHISAGLQNPRCNLETLRLEFCGLTEESCGVLASVFNSKSSRLTVLDASNNDLQDSGVKQLASALGRLEDMKKTIQCSSFYDEIYYDV